MTGRGQVPAARATARLLRHLAAQRGPVPAAALARELGLPRSSTYHLLAALVEEGLLLHYPEEQRYGLGVAASELGSGYLRQAPLARLGAPLLAAAVDRLGESLQLAVLQGREVVYVVEERARHRPALVSEVGVRLPAQFTASGRAMLAALDRPQVRALYPDAGAFAHRGDAAPTSPGELRSLLASIRAAGYAWEDGEVSPGLASVASAIRDAAGWPIAAVAITFRSDEHPRDSWPDLAEAIRPTATELQRRLGRQVGA
ncbi:IclR family transcriptional regulator [Agromyces seonyuensis]|uniref:Helix-turn-helix domain-containing protein n=1 Tax=Agromyces seonyuensis TaxID=2662446 RepID=A0A6I4P3H2_9MICO|nr:IclR family transcriptional regulator [Agromyces seonyuensis]MWB97774.1 helix-turn-helix domain-containing protein [Agromyces seonyuensis]